MKYLEPDSHEPSLIDIQGGGSDLIFPHHEMCAAQAQVISGKPLASTYVHAGMIGLEGEKMSKSKGNLVFVSKLIEAGRDPMAIRWALMKSHYRTDRMWTDDLLVKAEAEIVALRSALRSKKVAATSDLIEQIVECLADDLDTSAVIAAINTWVAQSQSEGDAGKAKELEIALDSLLGIKL
jgi:L-cysteine:1D-myo-inositol 2-amino-2-deoxy-alpha-D-glucopyranoside ligase